MNINSIRYSHGELKFWSKYLISVLLLVLVRNGKAFFMRGMHKPSIRLHLLALTDQKLETPESIEAMMMEVATSVSSIASDSVKLALVDVPLPVTGGTELDD